MLQTNFGKYKYLGLFAALNITFLLLSNFMAARVIQIYGIGVSVTVLFFPFSYLIADVLTEVYGYAQARSVIWLSVCCSLLAAVIARVSLEVPPAPFFQNDASYQLVFSAGPRVAIAGLIALFSGDICNSYVLAKIKIWSKGKHMWLRFIVSTIVGEGVNTLIFYSLVLFGTMSNEHLVQGVLMGWLAKTLVEIVMLPITYPVVDKLKKTEGVDYYDYATNFNPFITDETEGKA